VLDAPAFRQVMRAFPTGVTVVTTLDDGGRPVGLTVNSFTSVSLEPPLVLVCLDQSSASHDRVIAARTFVVNVLASDQGVLAARFAADPPRERFDGVDWRPGPGGIPILSGVAAWLACTLEDVHPGGDHSILVARVDEGAVETGKALAFYLGSYRTAAR
jgi:flavin reductase (DIM6/NTAB) family NADH-FMN oxidoreductase RutF